MRNIILLTSLMLALLFVSCSKSSTDPFDDLDLYDFSSIVKTDKGTYNFLLAFGLYAVNQQTTYITISLLDSDDANTSDAIILEFKGNSKGKYNLSNDNIIKMTNNSKLYESVSGTGNIEITSYGAVGSTITGKFSGNLKAVGSSEILKIESASFKAMRLNDDDDYDDDDDDDDDNGDDDGDDNTGNSSMKIDLEMEDGRSLQLNRNNLLGTAVYSSNILSLQSALLSDEEVFTIAVQVMVKDYDNSDNAVFEANADNVMKNFLGLTFEGMPYRFIGEFIIVKSAKQTGDYYEITAVGELFSLLDQSKAGTIKELYIKVYRD